MSLLHGDPSDDLVPASAVEELLRAVRIGLEQLEVEHQQAQLEVAELEAELSAHLNRPETGDALVAAARAAIESVAIGAQEHLGKVVAAAHANADARIAAAEVEALWIVQSAREEVARALAHPLSGGDVIADLGSGVALPALPTVADLSGWAIASPVPTTSPGTPTRPTSVPAPAAEVAVPERAPAPVVELDGAFWSFEARTAPRVGSVDGLATALLPMAAVVILLVVALLWIG